MAAAAEDPARTLARLYCPTPQRRPGAVAQSTFALTNATLPFVMALAEKGWRKALADDPHLLHGLNVHAGKVNV